MRVLGNTTGIWLIGVMRNTIRIWLMGDWRHTALRRLMRNRRHTTRRWPFGVRIPRIVAGVFHAQMMRPIAYNVSYGLGFLLLLGQIGDVGVLFAFVPDKCLFPGGSFLAKFIPAHPYQKVDRVVICRLVETDAVSKSSNDHDI